MKKRCGFVVLFLMVALFLWTAPAMSAFAPSLTITEEWNGSTVSFTATNSYSDIREFAVGNNDAKSAYITDDSHNSSYLIYGLLAWKDENTNRWYTSNTYGNRELTWLNNVEGFYSYSHAFLYTSWGYVKSGYNGYLETSMFGKLTNGYCGRTSSLESPFAAYSEGSGTITGETSAVPIPGAVWLLVSGIMGIMAIRRRKETV